MPAGYTHEHIALLALGEKEPMLPALMLGSCGPDVLYLVEPLSALAGENIGQRLHKRETAGFLALLLDVCEGSAVTRAYAKGFLTHYAADTVFHPYVYALSTGAGGYSTLTHTAVETALDEWMRSLGAVHEPILPEDGALKAISACLVTAVRRWDGHTVLNESEVADAMRWSMGVRTVKRHFSSLPAGNPYPAEKLFVPSWTDRTTNLPHTETPFDLLGKSIRVSEELARAADDYLHGRLSYSAFRDRTGDLSYLTGAPWQGTEGNG